MHLNFRLTQKGLRFGLRSNGGWGFDNLKIFGNFRRNYKKYSFMIKYFRIKGKIKKLIGKNKKENSKLDNKELYQKKIEEPQKINNIVIDKINKGEYYLYRLKINNSLSLEYELINKNVVFFSKWLVSNGNLGTKDQNIFKIKYSDNYNLAKIPEIISSDEGGLIEIFFEEGYERKLTSNDYLFAIYKDNNMRIKNRYKNIPDIKTDEFTNETRLYWKKIGYPKDCFSYYNSKISYSKLYLEQGLVHLTDNFEFTVENISGNDFIIFEYHMTGLNLTENDFIYFLLENKKIIEFKIKGKPYTKIKNRIKGYKIPIYKEEIELLANFKVEKIRVHLTSEDYKFDINHSNKWYTSKNDLQYVIKTLFNDYIQEVSSKISNYSPLLKHSQSFEEAPSNNETCCVYLMIDTTNNFHKIGISNQPKYREKTLQSEKPTIELLCSKKFPSRKIAESIEKALHDAFKEKNKRGEWFDLDKKDIEQIMETLKE